MSDKKTRIAVVAPSSRPADDLEERIQSLAHHLYGERCPTIEFHPQCRLSSGHFAGEDAARIRAFLDVANDPVYDAVWFARGGYGACRLLEGVLPHLTAAAGTKTYLGYSDAGSLLGGLYGRGVRRVAHGPMPSDIFRANGERAVARALAFLVDGAADSLEVSVGRGEPAVAFNITILAHLLGTPFQPDLAGHRLMLEEVSEYMYRIDRDLFQLTSNPTVRSVLGILLGRCSDIPVNDPDFAQDEEQVVRYWCDRSGIPYLGRADIGHDVDNKVVPFGPWPW